MMENVVEFCCFVNNTGFSHAAIDYAKSMRAHGTEISIQCAHNFLMLESYENNDKTWMQKAFEKKYADIKHQFRHLIPPRWRNLRNAESVSALAVFESTKPPPEWISAYKKINNVICPSEYCADVFWSAGLHKRPIVIPHAIDIDFWNIGDKQENEIFTILSVGTWRQRKNWKNTIEGCVIASKSVGDIKLIIKTDKEFDALAMVNKMDELGSLQIDVIGGELKDGDMRKMIHSSDCLLSASVGEGFCISPIQAMSCGIPVVCSAVGGCLEYVTDENCIRIDPRGYQNISVMDNIPQFRNQEWAIITAEDVAEAICKIILLNKEKKADMITSARKYIEDNFSYRVVGGKMMETILGS
jgi:glycosyltransferase involved in cell wall biosynthesis